MVHNPWHLWHSPLQTLDLEPTGPFPTIAGEAGRGVTDAAISGWDYYGTITLVGAVSLTSGFMATITFGHAFGTAPAVNLTLVTGSVGALTITLSASSTQTTFTLNAAGLSGVIGSLQAYYMVMGIRG